MTIKNKLDIFLITYNRKEYLESTFTQLLHENSPIKDFSITVLDNNSTDGTFEYLQELQKIFPNIRHIKNSYNMGWATISKAFSLATKEYLWVLCDDDNYNFDYWNEVEEAINNEIDIICCSKFILNRETMIVDEWKLLQLTLLPAGVYRTKHMNDNIMRNMYDNNFTMFPHLVLVIDAFNNNRKIKVLNNEILLMGENSENTDYSYTRGFNKLWPRNSTINWLVGFANICSGLNDTTLKHNAINLAIQQTWVYGSYELFYSSVVERYVNVQDWVHLMDLYVNLDSKRQYGLLNVFKKKHGFDGFKIYKKIRIDNMRIIILLGFIKISYKKRKK